ncbi:hypothetical protein D3C76_1627760 [compost metagenome]
MLLERPLQMRLVSKPRLQRDLGNRPAHTQLSTRMLHALIQQITMWSEAKTLAERTDQVSTRQSGCSADFFKAQRIQSMCSDERSCGLKARMLHRSSDRGAIQIARQYLKETR